MTDRQGYLTQVKQQNMSAVLRAIWEHGPISRVELSERTGLTSGTMTNLAHDLLKAGILREEAAETSGVGRRRMLLSFNKDQLRLIGVDIGRSGFEVVLADLAGNVLESAGTARGSMNEPDRVLDRIVPLVEGMRSRVFASGRRLLGIGVSIPGPMDWQRGVLHEPPNFPGWAHYPVGDEMRRRLGTKVLVNDDARASAIAERWFGLGRRVNHLVHVTLGMGIGGGVMMNGELLYGAGGLYGQVGHMTVDPGGRRCACGNIGCWETVGSIPALLGDWGREGRESSAKDFFAAVARKEEDAVRVWERAMHVATDALASLYFVYDPDVITIGGKLFPHLAPHLADIAERVRSRVYASARSRVRIEPSAFGSSQSAMGGAALIFDRFMREPLAALREASPPLPETD